MKDASGLRDADRTIQVLFEISNAVTHAVDLSELFHEIHLSLSKILNTDNFAIGLYHGEKDSLTFPYFVDEKDENLGEIFGVSRKQSLAGRVIREKKGVLVHRDGGHSGPEAVDSTGTPCLAWLGVPLRIRKRILGLLVLQSYERPDLYQESDIEILNTVSDFIAMAIERKQAEAEIRDSEQLTGTLFHISNAVNTARDLKDLYRTIHSALNQIIDVTNFIIGLYSQREKTITFEYYVDEYDDLMGQSLPLDSGSIGRDVILSGTPLFLDEAGVNDKMVRNRAVGTWPKTWLGVPLKIQDQVIGYMAAQSYSDPGLFTERDVALFSSVSDQVALAIDRKRSQEELNSNEKLTSTLFKIANAVNTTDNLDELYASIHRSLEDVMEARNFAIGLYDSHTDTITYPYYVDETGDFFREIKHVSRSGIKAGDVIRLKQPVFRTKEKTLSMARDAGRQIMGTVSEQWLGVPLKIQNQVRGVVVVQHYSDPDHYTQKDMDLLTAVSDQIALAIDRKQAQEAIKANEQLTRTLFRISNAVNTTDKLDELYMSIYGSLNRLINLPNFFICLVDREENTLHFPFYQDEYDSEKTISFTARFDPGAGGTITSEVINSKQPLFLTRDLLRQKGEEGKIVGRIPVVWLGVPLVIRDSVIGVMAVQHYHDPEYFSQKDMDLLVAVSDQVALALDRKQAQEAVLAHRANLEKRVAERTRKLTEEIRERIQVEAQLKRAKVEAESAARAKMEFLTNMSHEIRTPINGIMGMTEMAMDRSPDKELAEFIEIIDTEARHLLGIINDILDFSKIEAGKLTLDAVNFNLTGEFDQIASVLPRGSDPDLLEFRTEIAPDVPDQLTGDARRLRQILINLAANAIKFTPRGRVSITCEKKGETTDRVMLRFEVRDTGIGIPRDKQELIFESFSQVDGTTTREYGGTGLGTTISKQLVELMGGRIGLESTPGSGTCFWFELPFTRGPGAGPVPERPAGENPMPTPAMENKGVRENKNGLQILVAEDYPANQKIIQQFLAGAGHMALLAEDGGQAVAKFRSHRVDLILMDIQMPGMDGYEATRLIREEEAGREGQPRVPIIAVTAHAISGYREKCLEAGMDDYLSKPFRKRDLLGLVEKWALGGGTIPSAMVSSHPDPGEDRGQNREIFDLDLALEEFDNDREFLGEVLEEFLDTLAGQLTVIKAAIEENRAGTVGNEAHAIKGGAANLRAGRLSRTAHDLEKTGRSGDLSKAPEIFARLEKDAAELGACVTSLGLV